MKRLKIAISICLLLACTNIFAQTASDYRKAATQRYKDAPSALDDLVVSPNQNCNEYVDLGLSVKWATCNVGATKPWEYGGYYQWAGTENITNTGKELCWEYCPYHSGNDPHSNWAKYVPSLGDYFLQGSSNFDEKTVLVSSDDVAYVKLGGGWRMPTDVECKELIESCTWVWTTLNGVNGYKVTSKKPGYTDKSIFLPAAGLRDYKDELEDAGSMGHYWSSSVDSLFPCEAMCIEFSSNNVYKNAEMRYKGQSVRPVQK